MKSAFGLGEIEMERVRKFKPEDTEELIGIYIDTYAQEPWKEDWHP